MDCFGIGLVLPALFGCMVLYFVYLFESEVGMFLCVAFLVLGVACCEGVSMSSDVPFSRAGVWCVCVGSYFRLCVCFLCVVVNVSSGLCCFG